MIVGILFLEHALRRQCHPWPPLPISAIFCALLTSISGRRRGSRFPATPERAQSSCVCVHACWGCGFDSDPPCFPGLELNGMTGLDAAEVPPPLPLKGTSADYGALTENLDLTGLPSPPPPPPQQRVSQDSGSGWLTSFSAPGTNPSFLVLAC